MIINFEELKSKLYISDEFSVNYTDREVDDALLKKVHDVNVSFNAALVDTNEVHVNLDVKYNVDYLDARNLEPLNVDFNFQEEVLFTNDLQKAEELDIDTIEDELDLSDLVWELILVSVPFNYSEAKKLVTDEEVDLDNNEQQPFANLFKK